MYAPNPKPTSTPTLRIDAKVFKNMIIAESIDSDIAAPYTIRFRPILSDILPAMTETIAAPINNAPENTPVASAAYFNI